MTTTILIAPCPPDQQSFLPHLTAHSEDLFRIAVVDDHKKLLSIAVDSYNPSHFKLNSIYAMRVIKHVHGGLILGFENHQCYLKWNKKAPLPTIGSLLKVQLQTLKSDDKLATCRDDLSLADGILAIKYGLKKITLSKNLSTLDHQINILELEQHLSENIHLTLRRHAAFYNPLKEHLLELQKRFQTLLDAHPKEPSCLMESAPAFLKVIWDQTPGSHIFVESQSLYNAIKNILKKYAPYLLENISLSLSKNLFDDYGIEDDVLSLDSDAIDLDSKGTIYIQKTKALTAIDVNTGNASFASQKNAALTFNTLCAKKIVDHILLRQLSGMIVIDFLRMSQAQEQNTIHQIMKTHLNDAICHGFTKAGLYEITRTKKI